MKDSQLLSRFDKVHALLVEDESMQARLIAESLTDTRLAEFQLDHAVRLTEACDHLKNTSYDLILLDLNLPDSNELTTLTRVIEQVEDIPIVVLTSMDDKEMALDALRAGAQDYVVKGPEMLELLPRVCRYTVERYRLALEVRIARELEQRAYVDAVTGLMSRRHFDDSLNHLIKTAQRAERNFAILYIDLDRFKVINDSLGHAVGDHVLCLVAERLSQTIRESDILARIGGDEFALILEDLPHPRDAVIVASKLIETLNLPYIIGERELQIGTSIGIALYPNDCENSEELVRYADLAMYQAKNAGGNRYHFYSKELAEKASKILLLETSLRKAIDHNELLLHFQPIVQVGEGKVSALEALVRWQHPQQGMVPPDQFIPIAEQSSLIISIDSWVLEHACYQLKRWQQNGLLETRIAVNCSTQHFVYHNVVDKIEQVLERTGLAANYLELEITESALLTDSVKTSRILQNLRSLGVTISIDDFGTGYSSLSYLRTLPADHIKIDRSFLRNVPEDAKASALVSTIIMLAHNLELTVIAEGVETYEQWQWLSQQQCDYMQGYYIARPSPQPDFHQNISPI